MWKVQQINDNDMKKEQLVIALQDRALAWYIKYNTTNRNATLAETKNVLNVQFRKPKL